MILVSGNAAREIGLLSPDVPRRVRYLVKDVSEVMDNAGLDPDKLGESTGRIVTDVAIAAEHVLNDEMDMSLVQRSLRFWRGVPTPEVVQTYLWRIDHSQDA